MLQAAPFQTSLTYVGGRLVVVSRDGEGYRFPPSQLRHMLAFFDLMLAWTEPQAKSIQVGPYSCTPTRECGISLPFQLADGNKLLVPVAVDWLELMRPVFNRARDLLEAEPNRPFTLLLGPDRSIEELPPDRTTLRPA